MQKIKTALIKLVHWQYFPLLLLLLVITGLHLATIARPGEPLFDEQHYVPNARSIISGHGDFRVEHPPLAKLIIVAGMLLFGDDPWGWRIPAVIFGIIALIVLYNICRKLGTSHRTAFIATLLLGLENLTFIHSGIAMLDIFVVAFTLLAFWLYLKGPRWWWAAAIAVALAGLCKFSGILSIIPIGLHWLIIGHKPNMGNPVAPVQTEAAINEALSYETPAVASAQSESPSNTTAGISSPEIPVSAVSPVSPVESEPGKKPSFRVAHSRLIVFVLSMALAPVVFFLLYGVFDMIIWFRWIPFVVWGHWSQGTVGDIKNALSVTDSIKFAYSGAFPSRPWEWILSPTGSLYFYGWLFHPDNYQNIFLPYSYLPNYSGILSPTLWLGGIVVIPYTIWKSFKKNNAAIFIVCWIIGTWLLWVPLFLASNRITYIFYYLPAIGAVALGAALILTAYISKAQTRARGLRRRFLELATASFILFHLLSFCVLSPLHLWISIPVCAVLLLFTLGYLGFGWRFIAEFYDAAVFATLITRFWLFQPLADWLTRRYDIGGMPGVLLFWAAGAASGLAISWILYTVIHLAVNLINGRGTLPKAAVDPIQPNSIDL